MTKRFLLSLLLITLVTIVRAQCDSTWFRPAATRINDMSLPDTSNVIGVGDNGYIIKTTNGGKSWRNIPTFCNSTLKAVQFVTASIGYAAGDDRTILKTEDQGETWFALPVDKKPNAYNSIGHFNDVCFINPLRGFAKADNGMLVSTSDGGKNWQDTSLEAYAKLMSVSFVNDSLGFIVGSSGRFYKTVNAGISWTQISIETVSVFNTFNKVKFINTLTGFIVGSNGTCIRTIDGGSNWTKLSAQGELEYTDILLNGNKGFLVGSGNGELYETNDGGSTWTQVINLPSRVGNFSFMSRRGFRKEPLQFNG